MRRTDIPPTKSNLLRLKEDFGFVRSGHALLEQKREVLLEELTEMQRETAQLRRAAEAALTAAYEALRDALLANERRSIEVEALAFSGTQNLQLRERSIMGVVVPLLDIEMSEPAEPTTAPGWAGPGAVIVRRRVRGLLERLVHLAESEVSCHRLAAELQKTQRKVNALEHVFIPEHRDTIQFIESTLEEREREALFHRKRLKRERAALSGEEP
jgi:V/A-type H+-transporting ATPase subunit D